MSHPLDRPIWRALTTRLADFAVGDGPARRFRPDVNVLGAAADASPAAAEALAALVAPGETLATVEAEAMPRPPDLTVAAEATLTQMTLDRLAGAAGGIAFTQLGDADAADMLALATLTRPGPFLANTRRLGGFVGIREGGRLVAMAGERMKLPGWTEVSAVCTHPDFRGRGLAGALMCVVIGRILERGERAFLQVYATNTGAIALYEALGFRRRRTLSFTTYARQAAASAGSVAAIQPPPTTRSPA